MDMISPDDADKPINYHQQVYDCAIYALLNYCATLPLVESKVKSFAIELDLGHVLGDALKVDSKLEAAFQNACAAFGEPLGVVLDFEAANTIV